MALNVVDAVLEVAVAFGEVDLEQVAQQVLQIGAEVGRVAHLEDSRQTRHRRRRRTQPISLRPNAYPLSDVNLPPHQPPEEHNSLQTPAANRQINKQGGQVAAPCVR